MKLALRVVAFSLAVGFLILTVVNASWLAGSPRGVPKFVAHRGIGQIVDPNASHATDGKDDCTAARIEEPYHDFIENSWRSADRAAIGGAIMVTADLAATADGEMVVFADDVLDCRTDGKGPVRAATLAQLKALDIGYGYTADGGKSFPLRGTGRGKMPTLGEFVTYFPGFGRIMYHLRSDDPAEADLLAAKLKAARRDPEEKQDAFYGPAKTIARIRELYPEAWAWSPEEARQCGDDYVAIGWSGMFPDSCKGKTMVIPLDSQWLYWGWPNRLIKRVEENDGRIIVTRSNDAGAPMTGISLPEHLGEIPNTFNGHIWVEDSFAVLPARFPDRNRRTQEQIDATEAALEKRRAAQ